MKLKLVTAIFALVAIPALAQGEQGGPPPRVPKPDALVGNIGPEYSKMMDGLEQVDQNSSEGKEFMSILSGLDKLCTSPALAQSAQSAPAQPAQPAPVRPAPTQSAPVQPAPRGACAQIRAACTQAGFVPNGANMGVGIVVDCIRAVIAGTPQRRRATKPLPQIDPQVVVACKNQNPNFGMGGGAKAQPNGQPTNPSGTMEAPRQ
jgi:hypothetical protein